MYQAEGRGLVFPRRNLCSLTMETRPPFKSLDARAQRAFHKTRHKRACTAVLSQFWGLRVERWAACLGGGGFPSRSPGVPSAGTVHPKKTEDARTALQMVLLAVLLTFRVTDSLVDAPVIEVKHPPLCVYFNGSPAQLRA